LPSMRPRPQHLIIRIITYADEQASGFSAAPLVP
jgi:hypothetical protein